MTAFLRQFYKMSKKFLRKQYFWWIQDFFQENFHLVLQKLSSLVPKLNLLDHSRSFNLWNICGGKRSVRVSFLRQWLICRLTYQTVCFKFGIGVNIRRELKVEHLLKDDDKALCSTMWAWSWQWNLLLSHIAQGRTLKILAIGC